MSRGYNAPRRRWSKLKKRIEDLFVPSLDLKIYSTVYVSVDKHWTYDYPRHWMVLNQEVIFDFPSDFFLKGDNETQMKYLNDLPHAIGRHIQSYIETPLEILKSESFEFDKWKFNAILFAADRRIGKEKILKKFCIFPPSLAVQKILAKRFRQDFVHLCLKNCEVRS